MPGSQRSSSPWIYPDREAWEALLRIRPKPRPVMDKPDWWRGQWPAGRRGAAAGATSADRLLDRIRNELAWAAKCFFYAESIFPDSRVKEKVRLIANALERARTAVDTPAKAEDISAVADELAGVGRYDPVKHPRAFVETAGRSLSATGQAMEASTFEGLAYWGRSFVRAGGFLRAMKHDLPDT